MMGGLGPRAYGCTYMYVCMYAFMQSTDPCSAIHACKGRKGMGGARVRVCNAMQYNASVRLSVWLPVHSGTVHMQSTGMYVHSQGLSVVRLMMMVASIRT